MAETKSKETDSSILSRCSPNLTDFPKRKILIVDDEDTTRDFLSQILQPEGFKIIEAWYGPQAIDLFKKHKPDLVLLDLDLGRGESGFEVCEQLRTLENGSKTKIIMLTASTASHFKSSGYRHGIDFYITKPIDPGEIVGLIYAQFRNNSNEKNSKDNKFDRLIDKCGFAIDLSSKEVQYGGGSIDNLTKTQFDLLVLLLKKAPAIVAREELLAELRDDVTVCVRTIDIHICRLRNNLPKDAKQKIRSYPKEGYQITE